MRAFDQYLEKHVVEWRRKHVQDTSEDIRQGSQYPWILPSDNWTMGLWEGIREDLQSYVAAGAIQRHNMVSNLKSSWTQCANLYFPFRTKGGLSLLAGFLQARVFPQVEAIESLELEYAAQAPLDPQTLLGESAKGHRGANQTSPDLAFVVRTSRGKGLILVENKLTEHSFYECSGLDKKNGNPHPEYCSKWSSLLSDVSGRCWQKNWETVSRPRRTYWEHLELSPIGKKVPLCCLAAKGGYQLFRQQALAEGIAKSGQYDLVASCVAYDDRNDQLLSCLHQTGLGSFVTDWAPLFAGQAQFSSWTHQQWVQFVRERDRSGAWRDWLSYVEQRYGYGEAGQ